MRADVNDHGLELLEGRRLADRLFDLLDLESRRGRLRDQAVRHGEREGIPDEHQVQVVRGHAELVTGQPGSDLRGDDLGDCHVGPAGPVGLDAPGNGLLAVDRGRSLAAGRVEVPVTERGQGKLFPAGRCARERAL